MVPGAVDAGAGADPPANRAPRLLLASASPRRRELLTLAGIDFTTIATRVDELSEGDPEQLVVENALRKARAGLTSDAHGRLVLGADTEVVADGRALGKASDVEAARERLLALSGRTHAVLGGLALLDAEGGTERTVVVRTEVQFGRIEGELLEIYLRSGEWRDRAGAYAVQGLGSALIRRIDGDLANVIGLSIAALLELAPELAPSRAGPSTGSG